MLLFFMAPEYFVVAHFVMYLYCVLSVGVETLSKVVAIGYSMAFCFVFGGRVLLSFQVGLELVEILQSQPPECWYYRGAPPRLAASS